MSKFSWGHSFYEVNECVLSPPSCSRPLASHSSSRHETSNFPLLLASRPLIARYITCKTAAETVAMQEKIIAEMESEREERHREKGSSLFLSPSSPLPSLALPLFLSYRRSRVGGR